jgi:membrane protease YdiL (CAAX protease family)
MSSVEIESQPWALTLREVPWTAKDLVIGFAPIILGSATLYLLARSIARSLPQWLWIPTSFVLLAWMFAFPLWIAGRRLGIPSIPNPRRVLIEALIAAPAAIFVGAMLAVVTTFLSRFMNHGASPSPFEGIAAAPERYHSIALIIMAVVAAPLAEEVFFRGMVYNALRRRMHFVFAGLLQAAVFGFFHPFDLTQRLMISMIGFCLALLYEWRKTLVSPILLHSLNNGIWTGILLYTLAASANAPVLGIRGDPHDKGCLLAEVVPGGAAEEAGLRAGDVIVAAGENSVRNLYDIVLIMRMKKIGDRIPVWFIRDGKRVQVEAVLKSRPK